MRSYGGGPGPIIIVLIEEDTPESSVSLFVSTQRGGPVVTRRMLTDYKPGSGPSPETEHTGTQILDLQPLEL